MKKLTVLMMLGAFLIGGALFHSCKKDEMKDPSTQQTLLVKETSDFELPIYMGKHDLIGSAEIYIGDDNMIHVDVDLDEDELGDEGWMVTETHLYAAYMDPPASNAPGQFPYAMYDPGYDFSFDPIAWECGQVDWYFALQFQLEKCVAWDETTGDCIEWEEETAWLLPEEGGENWPNSGKGNNKGWGEYFMWQFDWVPVVTDIDLLYDPGMLADQDWLPSGTTYPVPGDYPNYAMCMDATNPFYFLYVDVFGVNVPLEMDYMNEFFLGEVTDQAFWDYWDAKGVDGINNLQGWELIMWDIINGDEPMFYLVFDGTDYLLIDGLQYLYGSVSNPLRISGDYPLGTYEFTGTVMGEYCESDDITIQLTVGCPE